MTSSPPSGLAGRLARLDYGWIVVGALALTETVPTVLMLGAANGTSTLARATAIAEIFGPRHYGTISGAIALGANGARALAPVAAALLQIGLGGYERLFWLLTAALVVAGIGVMLTDERR